MATEVEEEAGGEWDKVPLLEQASKRSPVKCAVNRGEGSCCRFVEAATRRAEDVGFVQVASITSDIKPVSAKLPLGPFLLLTLWRNIASERESLEVGLLQ